MLALDKVPLVSDYQNIKELWPMSTFSQSGQDGESSGPQLQGQT